MESIDEINKLDTIQKQEKLNDVFRLGQTGPGGAYHEYFIVPYGEGVGDEPHCLSFFKYIRFQQGARNEENSMSGVLDSDLLEIVRDRLRCFQQGDYSNQYNDQALTHVEEALYWLNQRVEDRIKRNVLGTYNK